MAERWPVSFLLGGETHQTTIYGGEISPLELLCLYNFMPNSCIHVLLVMKLLAEGVYEGYFPRYIVILGPNLNCRIHFKH